MITIKEIAKQLNMSTTTVSNVIHGKAGEVSDDTKRKVEEFLKKVDYVPNINASTFLKFFYKILKSLYLCGFHGYFFVVSYYGKLKKTGENIKK